MGCHPSHSLSYLSEGFKPPTRYVYEIILDYESSFFGTVSKVRHDKIHALVLHRRVCCVISEDSQKSWHAKGPQFFWMVQNGTNSIGRCFHIYSPRRMFPTYLFLLRLNPPTSWFINSIVYRLFYHKSHWCCFHQLIAKKLSKIAKSDERRPPITYLVPSVIPLSHHSG